MRKAMRHNEPNGNAGELMSELKKPPIKRWLFQMVGDYMPSSNKLGRIKGVGRQNQKLDFK